jgi:hypothetical protein
MEKSRKGEGEKRERKTEKKMEGDLEKEKKE